MYAKPLYYAIVFEPLTVMPIYLWLTLISILILKFLKIIEAEYMIISLRVTSPRNWQDKYLSLALFQGSTRKAIQ